MPVVDDQEPVPFEVAASATMIELIAGLIDESFRSLGEGVVMATMPGYLEAHGRRLAKRVTRDHLEGKEATGAGSALGTVHALSQVTDTDFEMLKETKGEAVKRLHVCEFRHAFEGRGEFPKAMICALHKAVYQGTVDPEDEGRFLVELGDTILGGAHHCDFIVRAREPNDERDTPAQLRKQMTPEESRQHGYDFYTGILASFISYLTSQFDDATVDAMLRRVADQVGADIHGLLEAAGIASDDAIPLARMVLRHGGRRLDEREDGQITVPECPQAGPIQEVAAHGTDIERVACHACDLCLHTLNAAIKGTGKSLQREASLAVDQRPCVFKETPAEP